MNELWIVRFVRKDGKPDEEYYYHFHCCPALKGRTTSLYRH